MPTGAPSGRNVLDIDVKDPRAWGFDTLADLGFAILPSTPMAHTASGGLHLHFSADIPIRNTAGKRGRGIGPGLDWRGIGGYAVLPSPGSGYRWDAHCGSETPLASIPAELLPRETEALKATITKPIQPCNGLSPYADAAINNAVRKIRDAVNGEQEQTINGECFAIGTLAGAGSIPENYALDTLIWAARGIPDFDSRRPWRAADLERKVKNAFADGMSHPREVRAHG